MTPRQILSADYLDIIFDGRNKAYGGYALRRTERTRNITALLFLFIPVSILCLLRIFAAAEVVPEVMGTPTICILKTIDQPVFEPVRKVDFPKASSNASEAASAAAPSATVPIIVARANDSVVMSEMPIGKPPGTDPAGKGTGTSTTGGSDTGERGDSAGTETVSNEPVRMTDVSPMFEGNLNAYLMKNLRYPEDAHSDGLQGRAAVQFIVERDGAVTSVTIVKSSGTVALDKEAQRVIRAMPPWHPGSVGGKAVRTYFVLPVSFVIE